MLEVRKRQNALKKPVQFVHDRGGHTFNIHLKFIEF